MLPPKVAIYARTAKPVAADAPNSVATQIAQCLVYATERGWSEQLAAFREHLENAP